VTETPSTGLGQALTDTMRIITNAYDPLNRLTGSEYSTSEQFAYVYDAVGNRTLMTSTTPLSGTVVTTHTYDAANCLTDRQVSDGRSYTYDWSNRNQMLREWTAGVPVRTFNYDSAGRMTQATVFTLTMRFTYDGDGARRVVEVVGHGTTTYTLDYAQGNRILAEETITGAITYLYGHDCLGQYDSAEDEWLYYLNDGIGYVRQGADEQGEVVSSWLFDPDGTVLEGPEGLVSHLICGGVYDWSTGLIYKGGRYFDPTLGIWLALIPLVVIQSWRGRKKRRRGMSWYVVAMVVVAGVGGMLAGCGGVTPSPGGDTPTPEEVCTYTPIDTTKDYRENLVSAFENLHVDLSDIDWDVWVGTDVEIQSTEDLVSTVRSADIRFDKEVLAMKPASWVPPNTISFSMSVLYGTLELALPALAHEAHHIYVGEAWYTANLIEAERLAWLIQAKVWRSVRQGYECDTQFFKNYFNLPIPELGQEAVELELEALWNLHTDAVGLEHYDVEGQRAIIKARYRPDGN
jgi:YD repeat-containing protein